MEKKRLVKITLVLESEPDMSADALREGFETFRANAGAEVAHIGRLRPDDCGIVVSEPVERRRIENTVAGWRKQGRQL